jgi:hypothetical protein
MRPLTKNVFRYAGILLLVSLLAASDRSAGQDGGDAKLISLNFPGGTVLAYVNAVRKAAGDINVVVAPEAGEVRMPAVTVKEVTVAAAMDLIDGQSVDMPGRRIQLGVEHMPVYDTRERQTYQVLAKVSGRPTVRATHVWTLSQLVDNDIPSAAVLSAVETAIEVVASSTRPDVRFHEDTALLIASGDHDQLEAIEHVLDSLNEAVANRRGDEMRQVEMQLQEIDQDRQHARDRLRQAMAEAQQTREKIEAYVEDTARLEMVTTELRRMLEMKDRELTAALAEVRKLQLELQQERSRREPGRSNPGR